MFVTVRAPASTSNLGPGFDCLGLALSLYSVFTFEPSGELIVEGCPGEFQNEDNLVLQGFRAVYKAAGETAPTVRLTINANVPVARGLGSSSTCIAAGAAAANAFLGGRFSKDELFEICAEFEGHPDNAAPCVLGGLTASFAADGRFHTVPLAIHPDWKFAVVVPDYEVKTSEARKAMPKEISVKDSVFTTSHCVALVSALASGDESLIRIACEDRLHEPCRRKLIPDYEAVRELALRSGAACFFISGSGSTLIAMTKNADTALQFTAAVREKFPTFGTHVLEAAFGGVEAQVE